MFLAGIEPVSIMENTGKTTGPYQTFNFVFTLNNYTEEDVDCIIGSVIEDPLRSQIAYVAFGFEVGEQGTPHLQGFLRLKEKGIN